MSFVVVVQRNALEASQPHTLGESGVVKQRGHQGRVGGQSGIQTPVVPDSKGGKC